MVLVVGNNYKCYFKTLLSYYLSYYSKIVLVAIQDEGSRYGSAAFDALKRLGASDPILTDYLGSYALAGYSGINKPSWVTQQQANSGQGPSEISLKVALMGKYISTVESPLRKKPIILVRVRSNTDRRTPRKPQCSDLFDYG